jgi:hypothetical protein
MSTVNYLLATWSGKRRNPSKEYLVAQIAQLSLLEHSLNQITVIRPAGSDDPDYYDVDLSGAVLLDRPHNDRAYGQFIFAFQQYPDFDYYIMVEDDYLPNIDNFDSILIDLLTEKGCDYLCGSYGSIVPGGPIVPRHNIGIITGPALRQLLKHNPNPYFHPNGENDGQEQEMFGQMCKAAGLVIKDYADDFPVPYYDRYLRYFSEKRGSRTLFVPYQLLHHKAFGYHGEEGDENSHFLSTMEFRNAGCGNVDIVDGQNFIGGFTLQELPTRVLVTLDVRDESYTQKVVERIQYECRGRQVTFLA